MGEGISAFGTTLKIGDGATPEVFAAIAEVTNVGGPGMNLQVANLDASEREKVLGALAEQIRRRTPNALAFAVNSRDAASDNKRRAV